MCYYICFTCMPKSSILWRTVWTGATSVTWVSTVGVKTNVIKRSQAQRADNRRSRQSNVEWLPWHAWRGGRLGWKGITETDSGFSRFVSTIRVSYSLIRNVSNLRKCRAYSWSPTRNRYNDETKTTADFARFYKYQLACRNMQWVTQYSAGTQP